jgi:hypothetical protein
VKNSKKKARGEQDRLTLADKIAETKNFKWLTQEHDKLQSFQDDKRRILQHKPPSSRIADQKQRRKNQLILNLKEAMSQFEL